MLTATSSVLKDFILSVLKLSSQTTLTEDAPLILDSTCSDKKIWPRFASIRMDIRRDVKPDIVASACYLPFRDGIFQEIYCDPPHIIGIQDREIKPHYKAAMKRKLKLLNQYVGWKSVREWLLFVSKTNVEFKRVLNGGVLKYKICDGNPKTMVQLRDLNRMDNFNIRIDKKYKVDDPYHDNITYFLTMKPKPIPETAKLLNLVSSELSASDTTKNSTQTACQGTLSSDTSSQ